MIKIKRYFNLVLGCLLFALGFNLFCAPTNIVPGGVSGVALLINQIIPFDKSMFILIVDIILLIFSYFILGKEKTKHSILGSLLFPLFVELTANVNNY